MKFLASLTKASEHQKAAAERHRLQSSSTQTELHLRLKDTVYKIPYALHPKDQAQIMSVLHLSEFMLKFNNTDVPHFLLEGIMWTLLKLNVKGKT